MNRKRIVTLSVAVINILLWIINIIAGGGSAWGLFISGGGNLKEYGEVAFGYIFGQGQWWRLLTCGYLHMGIFHLLFNLLALQMVGNKIEEYLGPAKTFVIYNLGTMITACIWCLIFQNGSIVGASLGIFVLMGILFVMFMNDRENGRTLLSVGAKRYLLCYIVLGCFLGMGTIVVHLIGFMVGTLIGFIATRLTKTEVQKP